MENNFKKMDFKDLTTMQKIGFIIGSVFICSIVLACGCYICLICMDSLGWLVHEPISSNGELTSHTTDTYSHSENRENDVISSYENEIAVGAIQLESTDSAEINESLNGRGRADNGREEPNYIGINGYAVISSSKEYELSKTDEFSKESLWTIPTYEKDKQFWYITDYVLSHKTEVVVIEQFLTHEGFGAYSGYLLVEELNSGKQVYIDVANYITKPYWTYTNDLFSAARTGYFVAEFNQKSDFYPVNKSGYRTVLDNGTIVLVTGTTGMMSSIKSDENGIKAIVWKEWQYGYGGVDVYFNEDDLSIIY